MDGRLVTIECRIVSSQLLTLTKRFGTLVERRHNVEPIRMNPTHSFQGGLPKYLTSRKRENHADRHRQVDGKPTRFRHNAKLIGRSDA